jgi:hypothetical protein
MWGLDYVPVFACVWLLAMRVGNWRQLLDTFLVTGTILRAGLRFDKLGE